MHRHTHTVPSSMSLSDIEWMCVYVCTYIQKLYMDTNKFSDSTYVQLVSHFFSRYFHQSSSLLNLSMKYST